jgi:hypothetical protein
MLEAKQRRRGRKTNRQQHQDRRGRTIGKDEKHHGQHQGKSET